MHSHAHAVFKHVFHVIFFEVLRLARNLAPGSLMIDAGVFDGTDWSLMGILASATVLGFEPLLENRKLIDDRLPARLGEYGHGKSHTFLQIEPGEAVPLQSLRGFPVRLFFCGIVVKSDSDSALRCCKDVIPTVHKRHLKKKNSVCGCI